MHLNDEIDNDCDEEVDADDPDTDMDEDGYGIVMKRPTATTIRLDFPGAGEICDPLADAHGDGEVNEGV